VNSSKQTWRQLFVAALTEVDSEKFYMRLVAADDAVFHRLFELECSTGTEEERLALEDTMQDILLIRNNCSNFAA
jgi:hypothetical protein